MQKYEVNWIHLYPDPPQGNQAGDEAVYLASEVDKRVDDFTNEVEILNDICERKQDRLDRMEKRIAELEAVLRKIATDDDGDGLTYTDVLHLAASVL